jgi:hypothetical protein
MQTSTVSFIDNVQSAISTYIPAAESIAAVVASLFNPAVLPEVEGIEGAVNVLIPELENIIATVEAVATSLSAAASTADPRTPVHIGTTKHGVAVHGYRRR